MLKFEGLVEVKEGQTQMDLGVVVAAVDLVAEEVSLVILPFICLMSVLPLVPSKGGRPPFSPFWKNPLRIC